MQCLTWASWVVVPQGASMSMRSMQLMIIGSSDDMIDHDSLTVTELGHGARWCSVPATCVGSLQLLMHTETQPVSSK